MINKNRTQQLNSHEYTDGPVLYWMNRDGRVHDNWALLYAQELALEYQVPLMVCYNLEPGFLGGGYRQHVFKIKGLMEVEKELHKLNIPFFIVSGQHTEEDLKKFIAEKEVGAVVTDFFPLRHTRTWIEYLRKNLTIPFYGVDAHNLVPAWVVSNKQEYAARTIRPKLHRLLPEYLEDFPNLKKHSYTYGGPLGSIDWDALLDDPSIDQSVKEVDWIIPGHMSAMKVLKDFLKNKFEGYATRRNDPNTDGQSGISPYLHYGHISAQRIAWEVVQHVGKPINMILAAGRNGAKSENDAATFLEELIIRRELSDNFCFYNPNYDSSTGFPEWAQKTLLKHVDDEREYVYTQEQFEKAQTHDDLWNAAQMEMVTKGKMHGYMRMYWAKKILEWTHNPDDAMKIAIYLNDKYELDGRDPNGYAGIAWSMGGVHDRPWFEREIFGTIRYMNRKGCERKFDVDGYISKNT
ncbi:deoxyribodipyrimidine photo-lyase [Candidatus Nomurabacteria bacterium]|nr:deoxyribodipyrimidine photo-lyase [Candidatus Nomurabacteria bacterium]